MTATPGTISAIPSEISPIFSSLESPPAQPPKPYVARTPSNPFRWYWSQRQIVYPKTPNLLNPSLISNSESKPRAPVLSCPSVLDLTTEISDDRQEAFKRVMEAVYKTTHF